MKCPKCGNNKFIAQQFVRGSVDVIVDEYGFFLENCTQNGELDSNGLDFSSPESPFECAECNYEMKDKDVRS